MKGSRPQKLPQPSPTSNRGRICSYPECETKLSVYNVGERCWQHADLNFPNYRGKRLAQGN